MSSNLNKFQYEFYFVYSVHYDELKLM